MEYGILGPLTVWDGSRELRLGAPKQRAVLAILLLHAGEQVATARIVDELWGEHPPATAVKAVQVYVSQLRKTLGEGVVETGPLGYAVTPEDSALDLRRFERGLERGRRLLREGAAEEAAGVLREALALWRGPPLADFRYEAFARTEIARLEELRLVALEHRLEADLALGRHTEAVPELETLVREHPLRESLRGLLILALYRSGRQADALAAYQEARATLVAELGLDPSQPLQRLEAAILQQDPALELPGAPPAAAAARDVLTARPARAPVRVCPVCHADNARTARFCHSCGTPLGADTAVEARKTVSVLFSDLVAFSELADRLDPESLRHVMSRFFDRATAVIEQHGGTVEKFVGDEVMAVFGVPAVREDDALRAVRAAQRLRESIAVLDSELGPEIRLQVRIGINTGEVVAGDPAEGHGFVTGDTVAVGKRLQQAAAPGEILLGEETRMLVAHAVQVTRLEPLALKGKRDAVAAFRLEAVDPLATALPHRDDTPLVNRERELAWLRAHFDAAAGGGGFRLVTVVGEPGIGKSRLVRELLAGLDGARVLVGRCPPYGEGITFWPLREVVRQLGREEALLEGTSYETFAAARRLFAEAAAERALVTVFDDVHWAEPTFLDLVEYLAARLGPSPLLVLCLARPELAAMRPEWLRDPERAVTLGPLSGTDTARLLDGLGTPAALRGQIVEAAEGNPLFVEQLAAIADERSPELAMPASIRGVLHERLDRLGLDERLALQRAAVAGRSFSLEDVLDLTRPEERDRAQAHLHELVRKGLLRPEVTDAEGGFRFGHALIRDAAYEALPKAAAADLHERMAARRDDRPGSAALVGYHLERAFLLRRELGRPDPELGARAGRLLLEAARETHARSDLPATISLFGRARELLPPPEGARLLPRLGQALFEAGRFAEADATLAEAIEQAAGDSLLELRARVEQQFVRLQADAGGAIAEARRVADDALETFEARSHAIGRCRARCLRAWLDWIEGDVGAADDGWRRAADDARAAADERELFEILGWRASAAVEGPAPVGEAIRTCTEISEQVRGSPVAYAVALHPLAALHAMRGEIDEARALIREGNAILDDAGRLQSAVSHHEAAVEMLAGDAAEAAERLRAGYERLEQMGEKAVLATTAAMLAQALYAQGRFEEADRFCAVGETAAVEDLSTQVIWRGVRAKLLARQGRGDEGAALALDAVRLVTPTDLLTRQGDALLDLAEVLRLADRPAEADAAAGEARRRYVQKGNVVSAERARSAAVPVETR